MKLVGIDLSTNPRDCGICVLEDHVVTHVGRGAAHATHPEWLLSFCDGSDVVAVDAPFGWPKPFIEALSGYELGNMLGHDRKRYRYRATDTWITEELPQKEPHREKPAPPTPLSVSTDKLGSTAMVATILLRSLAEEFRLSPRVSKSDPAVIEVYPAASLWACGLPHKGFKGFHESARNKRAEALAGLKTSFDLETSYQDDSLTRWDHCFDALVAALTAREYSRSNTFDPPERFSNETLNVEGWIRVPSRTIR